MTLDLSVPCTYSRVHDCQRARDAFGRRRWAPHLAASGYVNKLHSDFGSRRLYFQTVKTRICIWIGSQSSRLTAKACLFLQHRPIAFAIAPCLDWRSACFGTTNFAQCKDTAIVALSPSNDANILVRTSTSSFIGRLPVVG